MLSSCLNDNMLSIDVYSLPHKALRTALADAGTALGATDDETLPDAAALVSAALDELHAHADHEDTFIQPVIERFLPDLALAVADQHTALDRMIDAVRRQLDVAIEHPQALVASYRSYQRLVAANL